MKALIKQNAARWGNSYTKHGKKIHEYLLANRGQWVEIDTNVVFDNQYNTVDGFRIYDADVERIEGDTRTDRSVFFVKHPNGHDPIKIGFNVTQIDHRKEGYYSAYEVNGLYYRISKRENIEFVLVDGVPYTVGIGYKKWIAPNERQRKIMDKVLKLLSEYSTILNQ